jgi:hypothetical protein
MKTRFLRPISVVVLALGCVTILGGKAEARAKLSAAPQLSVGPPLPISDPVFQSPARNEQRSPRVATGNLVQLVVWQDQRGSTTWHIFRDYHFDNRASGAGSEFPNRKWSGRSDGSRSLLGRPELSRRLVGVRQRKLP